MSSRVRPQLSLRCQKTMSMPVWVIHSRVTLWILWSGYSTLTSQPRSQVSIIDRQGNILARYKITRITRKIDHSLVMFGYCPPCLHSRFWAPKSLPQSHVSSQLLTLVLPPDTSHLILQQSDPETKACVWPGSTL